MIKTKFIKLMIGSIVLSLALAGCTNSAKNNQVKQNNNNQAQSQNQTENSVEEKVSFYYTANEGGSISKIDAATNKVVETIKDEGTPHNVQVSPDGKVVAYTSPVKMTEEEEKDENMGMNMGMNGSAVFYDVETGSLITKTEVGKHPAHVVFTGDGRYVLVTNNEDDNVSIIDAKTYKLINNVPVGKGPHGFRISKDNKFAYIANMGSDTVSVVDIENNKEIKKIQVGKTPVTTGITGDGRTLFVTINAENAVAVVDLTTDKVEKITVGIGPAQLYVSPDENYVYVANQGIEENPSNTVSKIDIATKKVVTTIETGKGAHGVVVSPDNKFVYVTNMYDNTVSVIDAGTDKVVQTVQVDREPNGISYKQ